MNLLVRRRVLWDCLAGALWVLLTVSVVVFLAAGMLLSRVSISDNSPWPSRAAPPTPRNVLIVDGLHPMHSPAPHSWDVPSTRH